MRGMTAVITGATSGIGKASMAALAAQGAAVIGVGRDAERCREAADDISRSCPGASVEILLADLSRQSEVRRLAADIRCRLGDDREGSLDVLVNNAGIYSSRKVYTDEGVELMLAVNHVAPFLLTHELMPLLARADRGRVVTISSASHYHAHLDLGRLNAPLLYFGLWRYQLTKLANVLFTNELNRRFGHTALRAFAVDPGLVNTAIGKKHTDALARLVWKARRRRGVSPEVPARTVVFLASEASLQGTDQFYWRNCQPKESSQLARDANTAHRLWEATEKLCGVTW